MDTDGETKITLNVKSNLFRDVSKMASNTTLSIKLPKTTRNQALMGHVDLVQSDDVFPYLEHKARYFRNGVEVIKDGRVRVLKVSDDAIEISIVWGLFPKFSALITDGTSLNELESDAKIMWKNINEVASYEEAKVTDYFFPIMDTRKYETITTYDWYSFEQITYPESGYSLGGQPVGTKLGTVDSNRHSSSSTMDYKHPCVKVSWVLEQIRKNKGVTFNFIGSAKEYIDTLIIPLINKKSNELTFGDSFAANIKSTNTFGTLAMVVTTENQVFDNAVGGDYISLKATTQANVIFDIKTSYKFELGNARPNGTGSMGDSFSFRDAVRIKMKVGDEEYILGAQGQRGSVFWVPRGYRGEVRFEIKGNGKIEVKKGQEVTFELIGGTKKSFEFLGGTITATLIADEDVPRGGFYPIAHNLPKIKIIDFVKFLSVITGTFPLQMAEDGVVDFYPVSIVWNFKYAARDWTNRVMAQKRENKPNTLEFAMTDYAQHNYYKWKEDDYVVGNYDGDIQIDNQALEKERTILEFPFAACDGNNVPIYSYDTSDSDDDGGLTPGERPPEEEDKGPSYEACSDRILRFRKSSDNKAEAFFDINMQTIINERYADVLNALQNTKVIKEKMRIRDIDIMNFDEMKPVFLAQYGAYFAVLEIKSSEIGIAEVTMLQI